MTAHKQIRLAMAAIMTAILAAQLTAQSPAEQTTANRAMDPVVTAAPNHTIVVSLEDRKLALVEDGKVKRVYTVAVGKPSTPSPEGTFIIQRRVANPTYSHDGRTVPPGPNNPVGTRWMGLSIRGYGIHGTNEPRSIGKAASHGCIRMAKSDLEELYLMVAVGDTVELVGKRNQETAQLFDGAMPPTAQPAAPTAIVSNVSASGTPAVQQSASASTNKTTFTGAVVSAIAGATVAGSM